jgi:hypothetical protein
VWSAPEPVKHAELAHRSSSLLRDKASRSGEAIRRRGVVEFFSRGENGRPAEAGSNQRPAESSWIFLSGCVGARQSDGPHNRGYSRKPPQGKIIAPSTAKRASDWERRMEKEEGNAAPPVGARSLARHPGFPFVLLGAVPPFSKELCELAGVLAEGRRISVHHAGTVY